MTLGHQLAAMDRSTRSEPNGMVAERKWTYRTEATTTTVVEERRKDEKVKKKKTPNTIPAMAELPSVAEAEEAD